MAEASMAKWTFDVDQAIDGNWRETRREFASTGEAIDAMAGFLSDQAANNLFPAVKLHPARHA